MFFFSLFNLILITTLNVSILQFSSVFVVSDSLQPCELQHARLPCPSLHPWVCPNSCPLGWWCHPTISSSSPLALNLSQHQGLFQWVSFSISPSSEYSGLISFRIDCFDLFAVQGNLKSLLQHHSSKASILQCSAFFMVQLSHPYMTTWGRIDTCIYAWQSSFAVHFKLSQHC